ncbi:hypothetical protein [Nonomuraea fuscirosea]|uniref:hypothetical protein n=1 Tax=Nonomuraea fuscirosea TaxID=1291556 RepID=UPI003405EE6C
MELIMSHHLDSPLARQDPRLDISDVYLFRGTIGTTFIINVNPLSGAGAFHPEGRYEFKIGPPRESWRLRFLRICE